MSLREQAHLPPNVRAAILVAHASQRTLTVDPQGRLTTAPGLVGLFWQQTDPTAPDRAVSGDPNPQLNMWSFEDLDRLEEQEAAQLGRR